MPRNSKVNVQIRPKAEAATYISDLDFEKRITLATDGLMTKFFEFTLRVSQENASVVADYIIAMKREVNPRLSYKR